MHIVSTLIQIKHFLPKIDSVEFRQFSDHIYRCMILPFFSWKIDIRDLHIYRITLPYIELEKIYLSQVASTDLTERLVSLYLRWPSKGVFMALNLTYSITSLFINHSLLTTNALHDCDILVLQNRYQRSTDLILMHLALPKIEF